METLYYSFYQQIKNLNTNFIRFLYKEIDWNDRLISIIGARGSGKTTLLLQYIKNNFGNTPKNVLYVSLDNFWFQGHSLWETAQEFVQMGGKLIVIDEVHKYANWSQEIKNIYDSFPTISIIFTGSSILEVFKGEADLSRRMISYHLHGLSFREFLNFENNLTFSSISLKDLQLNHLQIAAEITNEISILPHFQNYLKYGYYPYYKESKAKYAIKLQQTINAILEFDLPSIEKIDYCSIIKIKKLLYILSKKCPFTPNVTQLSEIVGVSRNTLLSFIQYLSRAQLLISIEQKGKSLSVLAKPEKIYLNNPNICYAIAENEPNLGTIRETNFANQLIVKHKLQTSSIGDFLIDDKIIVEVGGKNKSFSQINNIENSFLALDNIEIGYGNKIPLWLFGFLY